MSIFNNPNYFPTSESVINRMVAGSVLTNKVILEPHGGSGNIIDFLKNNGVKEVLTCEKDEQLSIIAAQKADRFICNDFYDIKREDISHIDMIVANPPFHDDVKQILKMWEIAPDGCEIRTLCNWETVNNTYTGERRELSRIIANNGYKECFGECFKDAERKTDVKVGFVCLHKPKQEGEDEWKGYFDLNEEYEYQENGIIKYDEVKELVNRYVAAVDKFDSVIAANKEMQDLISPICKSNEMDIKFGAYHQRNTYSSISREEFKKELQKSAWKSVFGKFDMSKYLTSKTMEKVNKFVEQQTNVPFTRTNIFKMIEMIVGTHGGRVQQVIVEAFDKITSHHHENRYSQKGWKTNDEYRVGKKFILPWMIEGDDSGGFRARWDRNGCVMDDINKALCYVTGTDFKKHGDWHTFCLNKVIIDETKSIDAYGNSEYIGREFSKWYDWGFFEVKGFKNRNLHVKFKSEEVWEKFNQVACKEKGFVLASKFTSDFRKKTNGVEIYE